MVRGSRTDLWTLTDFSDGSRAWCHLKSEIVNILVKGTTLRITFKIDDTPLPSRSFTLVSRIPFTHHNRGFGHFFSAASSSRRETMVGDAFTRTSTSRVALVVSGTTIVSGSCSCPSHLWISRVFQHVTSLGISSLFCRATQCMWGM